MDSAERQAVIDDEHLRWLSIGYFISAGLSAFVAVILIGYFGFLGVVLQLAPHDAKNPAPAFVGIFIALILAVVVALVAVFTWAKVQAGRNLRRRRSRSFCMVVAALCCFGVPWGTLLGVATLIVLSRPSVAALFGDTPL